MIICGIWRGFRNNCERVAGTDISRARAPAPHRQLPHNLLMIQTLEWTEHGVRFIDQTKLPTEETYVNCTTYLEVADVIRNMVVRLSLIHI